MKVIVIGAGEVGSNIARHLRQEDQDVVVIDSNPERLAQVAELLDVQVVEGHGSRPDVLEAAGCGSCDMLVAVTDSDEVNMVACQVAHSLYSVSTKIARVRDVSYFELARSWAAAENTAPVDLVISPEIEVAGAVLRTLMVPGAFDVHEFFDGKICAVGARVLPTAAILGLPLEQVYRQSGAVFKVMAVFRRERLIIPEEADHLEKDDLVYMTCAKGDSAEVMAALGYPNARPEKVFILGGGNVGLNVATRLERVGIAPRLLEINHDRAEFLAESLSVTTVLHGSALDKDILNQENVSAMDVVVVVTQDDATNILSSVLVQQLGCRNVVTLVNNSSFVAMVESLGLDKVIAPGETTVSRVLRYLRESKVVALHSAKAGAAELIEVELEEGAPLVGATLAGLTLPYGINIGGVYRGGQAVTATTGDGLLHTGDRIVLFVAKGLAWQADHLSTPAT